MRYAKLLDSILIYAPRRLRSGENVVYNPPGDLLTAQAWKPVTYTDQPDAEEGNIAVIGWTETEEAIVQTWTVVPEGDIPDAEALEILMGGETG